MKRDDEAGLARQPGEPRGDAVCPAAVAAPRRLLVGPGVRQPPPALLSVEVDGRQSGDDLDGVRGRGLRGLGLVDERSLGTIAQRQMRIRERARALGAARAHAGRRDVANLAERLARNDMAAAAAIANRDHQVAIGEAPQLATPPSPAIKLAPAVNGAKKPKSPAHAARRASGVARGRIPSTTRRCAGRR